MVLGTERFLREIDTVARLNHPHILPLHDSGESGGVLYFVMPFIEGASLRLQLGSGRHLGVDQALAIAAPWPTRCRTLIEWACCTVTSSPRISCFHKASRLSLTLAWRKRQIGRASESDTHGAHPRHTRLHESEQAVGVADLDERSDVYSWQS